MHELGAINYDESEQDSTVFDYNFQLMFTTDKLMFTKSEHIAHQNIVF